MSYATYVREGGIPYVRSRRRNRRQPLLKGLLLAAALAGGVMSGFWMLGPDAPETEMARAPAALVPAAPAPQAPAYSGLLDPALSGGKAASFVRGAPFRAAFQPAPPVAAEPALPLPPQPQVTLAETVAPLPVPRPSDLLANRDAPPPRLAQPTPSRRNRAAAAQPTPEDNRNFFEKLFGVSKQPAGTALAYAAPQDEVLDRGRVTRLSPSAGTPPRTAEAGTAIYDIAARTVHMPNGERLEAHSGLGEMMDDVRYAHVRMKGVTPPHTYTLTEREALFHGVRAIRLNPVGGSGAIHGRAGLLAHTYLLGPRGDSNGCISFKDYDRFLQAFLRGEVKRIVVVASL
ncbi:DUF2778 domain-containing protein [Bosea sp. (in: a-proteobacteria)]|uniref:DUF2778 domain-containing protein n=1 Tax=Bosea sp. (in: a-proteobacteria) TaxID=1871050 RepID=UPI0026073FFA|nr:DUF2778 domain-containing protein [Bosea sp. (in: a-proteobacteria)]MCO5092948.1 DUF2778 domain-containing protein [Bosea sp. (in: a-proteobacteria)]